MKHLYALVPTLLALFCTLKMVAQPINISTQVMPTSCAACNGSIDMTVTGGTPPYIFDWNNIVGANNPEDMLNLCAGNYTVTVTDATGATKSAIATVTQPSNINVAGNATHISCFGGNNGAITVTITGGNAPYTSVWSNGATTKNISGLTPGTYTTTVTDANGCTKTASIAVSQAQQLNPTLCVTNTTCFGICSGGEINLSVAGGTPGYTYLWGNGATTQDIINICAGTYTVTITDSNNCTKTASGTVNEPAALTLSATVTNGTASGSSGAIDLTATGGTAPYLAQWSNGLNTFDAFDLPAGTYCVTVTDANGCTRSSCYTVQGNGGGPSNNGPLLLNGQATNSGCGVDCTGTFGISLTNGSAPYFFTVLNPDGSVGSGTFNAQSFQIGYAVCAGTYCVTVTDASNSTASICLTVGQGQSQNLDIQSSNSAFCNFDPNNTSNVCEMVCPHSTVTYFVDPPVVCGVPMNLSGATWTVSGAASYTVNPGAPEVVVTWGDAGPGLVEFGSGTQQLCFKSTHCVTVLEEPKAQFSTDPPSAPNAVMQLCKGQTVTFKNESLNTELYEWTFSDDLSVVEEENPTHTFRIAGNFTVTLIARNTCLCADTTVLSIEVLDSEPPLLDCVGSVCPGETVTYSTSAGCSAYNWSVSPNGSIVQGGQSGDNTITIQWGDGPVGSISLSASGCAGASCPQASVFNISIISDNAEIRGKEFVCPSSEEEYNIDLFDGTEYTWALPTGGSILRGQGTNKVTIEWDAQVSSVTHWLIVDYYNCYLGCGGVDSIPVKIIGPFYISGPVEMCENSSKNYLARNAATNAGVNCDWSVFGPNGTLISSFIGSTLSFTPTAGPGNYRLFAVPNTPGQSCSPSAELKVSVVARPPNPIAISGPVIICPSTPVQYEVPGNPPYEIVWTTGNGTPATQSGNPVNVTWNTNPTHWLSAMQVSLDGLGCKSDTTKLNIQNASNISISGTPAVCEGSLGSYTADYYQGFDYQWEILPTTAGIVKQGQGKNNVEIFWQAPGTHLLRVTACGLTTDFNVAVLANPTPVPEAPDGVCPGDSGLVTVSGTFNAYAWHKASGASLGNGATVDLPPGAYTLEVTDSQGCRGTSEFVIDPLPRPNVSVTTAQPAGFCNNSITVDMTALTPDDGIFDYQWLKDGAPIGGNSVVYSTNQYGLYTVVATNEYGCSATAPPIKLFEYCQPDCGGFCPHGGSICAPGTVQGVPDFTPRCDSFAMVLNDYSGLYVPGSASWWTGISGTSGWDFATGDSVHFVYPNAGKYIVIVTVLLSNGQVCKSVDSLDVEVAAQFSQKLACPGDSTFFTDESTRLPEMSIASWNWDFGEAGSADNSNLDSPGYPYLNPGNYTATLTITSATGCSSTYSENVFVPSPPVPAFAPPLANCAGNATPFVLASNTGIINTAWEFGDPASGALNQSAANPAYHSFSPAGNYPVTVTATNSYGCTGSVTQPVNITANPFSGIISPPTSVICQGSSLTLNAPLGPGAMYVWNDATNLPTLTVTEEGVYDVTLTNANGCSYSPPAKTVDVNPAPIGTVKFLEINDLGQVVSVQYPSASVCAGEDVTLQIQDNGNYTYSWSGGNGNDEVLIFSEARGNLLSVGTHTFTVTVTNPTTGCTAVLAPFTVTVNPLPDNFSLSTNNVCAGTPSTITYAGPQPPDWHIIWNTGDVGPSLQTEQAGLYFVRVVNQFGCSAQSNTVVIFPGPNIAALPSGCHERCNPDTLCLPSLPEIVSWQWFYEGVAIPGATSNQFAATQSGTYWAELVDLNGCEATSAPLTVELYNGFGNVLGQVWSDVNNNGVIDAADTLVAGIPVQLLQNGTLVAPNQSGVNGGFNWLNVLSTGYTVQIDTQLLSPLWEIVILSDSVTLNGCGGKAYAQLLVDAYQCPPIFSAVTLSACPGQSAVFNGTSILAGQSADITLQSILGCDSVITVTVTPLPVSSSTLNASACPGSFYQYNGVDIAAGQSQDFHFTNWLGCDSIVTVSVAALPVSSSTFNVSACPGSFYQYNGVDIAAGQSQDFTLSNPATGCDSIVTVVVSALPVSSSTLNASVCPGSFYQYNGVDIAAGQSQDFTLNNPATGCDSVVTVVVSAFPVSSSTLNASVCPGSFYPYNGVDIAAGQSQDFTLTNPATGCDSVVTVVVSALPVSSSTLNASACPGSFYQYNGVDIAAGQSQDFTLSNPTTGCDSVVTVVVSALPVSSGAATFGVCPNETYTYEGVALTAGTVQNFTLKTWLGCDSIVTVSIFEKHHSAEIQEVKVCPGETYLFQNQEIAAGETRSFHWTNAEGCDSTITIAVTAWPSVDFDLTTQISCPNSASGSITVTTTTGIPVDYSLNQLDYQTAPLFEALAAGTYTVYVRDEHNCIFEKPAEVLASPALQIALPDAMVIPCDSARIILAPSIQGDTNGLQLLWWNGASTPSVTVSEAGPLWLEASNQCETVRREGEVLWADSEGDPVLVFVPNAFAPDADLSENAMFRPFFGNNLRLLRYRLEVYDRWGNLVFVTESPENGWLGKFGTANTGTDVFVYQMWARIAFCGKEIEVYKKGDVTVLR